MHLNDIFKTYSKKRTWCHMGVTLTIMYSQLIVGEVLDYRTLNNVALLFSCLPDGRPYRHPVAYTSVHLCFTNYM